MAKIGIIGGSGIYKHGGARKGQGGQGQDALRRPVGRLQVRPGS